MRFGALTSESGRPEVKILWLPPEKDREFMREVKENRVVTLKQPNVGTRRDFGVVGFLKEPNANYLVFPKPIRHDSGAKVVGIKYENIARSKPADPVNLKDRKERPPGIPLQEAPSKQSSTHVEVPPKTARTLRKEPAPLPKKEPELKKFRILIKLTAEQSVALAVSGKNKQAALKQAKDQIESLTINPQEAAIKRKIVSAEALT